MNFRRNIYWLTLLWAFSLVGCVPGRVEKSAQLDVIQAPGDAATLPDTSDDAGPFSPDQQLDVFGDFSTLPPANVLSASPLDGETAVRLDVGIVITFDSTMNTQVTEQAFSLIDGKNQPVPGQFHWNGDQTQLTFLPLAPLAVATTYQLKLLAMAGSVTGKPLVPFSSVFHTGGPPPQPGVAEILPPLGSVFVVNLANMDSLTILGTVAPDTWVELMVDGSGTAVKVLSSGNGAFTFATSQLRSAGLAGPDKTIPDYTLKNVSFRLENAFGVSDVNNSISFGKDTVAPTNVGISPASMGDGLPPTTTALTLYFSEALDPSTVTANALIVEGLSGPSAYTVSYSNLEATISLMEALTHDQQLTIRATALLRDVAGNPLIPVTAVRSTTLDALEPNGNTTVAPVVTIPGVLENVKLHSVWDAADLYRIALPFISSEQWKVTLEVYADLVDNKSIETAAVKLSLLDDAGQLIDSLTFEPVQGDSGKNGKLTVIVPHQETYFVKVEPLSEALFLQYKLFLSKSDPGACAGKQHPDPYDPNDDYTVPTPISVGGLITAQLCFGPDTEDYYKITLSERKRLTVTLKRTDVAFDTDVSHLLGLLRSDGKQYVSLVSNTPTQDVELQYTLHPGTYLVRVGAFKFGGSLPEELMDYTLSTTLSDPCVDDSIDQSGDDDVLEEAIPLVIAPGAPHVVNGRLCINDADWRAVPVAPSQKLTVSLSGATAKTSVVFYTDTGSMISGCYNFSGIGDFAVSCNGEKASDGKFYVQIRSTSALTADGVNYTASFSVEPQ